MTGGHLVPENDPVGQPRKPVPTDSNNHHNDNNHHHNNYNNIPSESTWVIILSRRLV